MRSCIHSRHARAHKHACLALRTALVVGETDEEGAAAVIERMEAERRIQMETW